eukprot:PhF_6_TR37222/c0_g1_i1/m.54903
MQIQVNEQDVVSQISNVFQSLRSHQSRVTDLEAQLHTAQEEIALLKKEQQAQQQMQHQQRIEASPSSPTAIAGELALLRAELAALEEENVTLNEKLLQSYEREEKVEHILKETMKVLRPGGGHEHDIMTDSDGMLAMQGATTRDVVVTAARLALQDAHFFRITFYLEIETSHRTEVCMEEWRHRCSMWTKFCATLKGMVLSAVAMVTAPVIPSKVHGSYERPPSPMAIYTKSSRNPTPPPPPVVIDPSFFALEQNYRGEVTKTEMAVRDLIFRQEEEVRAFVVEAALSSYVSEEFGLEVCDVVVRSSTSSHEGAVTCVVREVIPDGPADNSGMMTHDVVEGIDEFNIARAVDFRKAVRAVQNGQRCNVRVRRNGNIVNLRITPVGGTSMPYYNNSNTEQTPQQLLKTLGGQVGRLQQQPSSRSVTPTIPLTPSEKRSSTPTQKHTNHLNIVSALTASGPETKTFYMHHVNPSGLVGGGGNTTTPARSSTPKSRVAGSNVSAISSNGGNRTPPEQQQQQQLSLSSIRSSSNSKLRPSTNAPRLSTYERK